MDPKNILVGLVASGLSLTAFAGMLFPEPIATKWGIAKLVQARFGNGGVRALLLFITIAMGVIAFQLFSEAKR
jgi:hypothetical protein